MTWPVQFRDETSARWPWMAQTLPSDHHGFPPFHFVGCSGTAFTCKERWGRSSTLSHIPQHHQAYLLFYMSLSKGALLYTLQLDNKINKLTQPPSRIMNQIIISSRLSPAGLAFPSSQSQPLQPMVSLRTWSSHALRKVPEGSWEVTEQTFERLCGGGEPVKVSGEWFRVLTFQWL